MYLILQNNPARSANGSVPDAGGARAEGEVVACCGCTVDLWMDTHRCTHRRRSITSTDAGDRQSTTTIPLFPPWPIPPTGLWGPAFPKQLATGYRHRTLWFRLILRWKRQYVEWPLQTRLTLRSAFWGTSGVWRNHDWRWHRREWMSNVWTSIYTPIVYVRTLLQRNGEVPSNASHLRQKENW